MSHVSISAVYEEIRAYGRASCAPEVIGCSIITAPLLSHEEVSCNPELCEIPTMQDYHSLCWMVWKG